MTAAQRTPLAPALVAVLLMLGSSPVSGTDPEQLEFFEKQVRPILATHCYECHSVQSRSLKAGLRVDSRSALLKGGDSGPAISEDKPEDSLLLAAVRYEDYEMPPKGKLPERDISIFEKWVRMGAPWPNEPEPVADSSPPSFDLAARKSSHWCWQPIRAPKIPVVVDVVWPRDDIDRFILAKLDQRGLKPAPSVDRRTLIRRLSFDLIGLPPTPDESTAFIQDAAPNAVERVVDRLLESPHFGERWGRHWLDLVRYAESRGHEFDNDTPNAWQYRDYVIRTLNADVPYDQFVKEHIAGDLLDPPRLHPERKFNESILGTGFWHLGEWAHSPVDIRKDETDRFDNMLDVMSKAFLGVTVSCARCHDHKFDAISQKDYYALSGFLQGSDYRQVPFEALEHNKWLAGELAKVGNEANRRFKELVLLGGRDREMAIADAVNREAEQARDGPGEFPDNPRIVFDYRSGDVSLIQDGAIYGQTSARPGEWRVRRPPGDQTPVLLTQTGFAQVDPLWDDVQYALPATDNQKGRLESLPRLGRTLRSPSFAVESGMIHCRVRGTGHIVACVDSHRLIAGPLHGETIVEVKDLDQPSLPRGLWRWVKLNLKRYIGHRVHLEFTPAPGASLDIQLAVDSEWLNLAFLKRPAAITPEEVDRVLRKWHEGHDLQPIETRIISSATLIAVDSDRNLQDEWKRIHTWWIEQRDHVKAGVMKASALAPAMLDGTGEDDRLLIRGNSSTPGEVVPRRFLEAVDGPSPMTIPTGSGRRQLAERIVDPANPLTSRVIVNRLWHHLMGLGIVPTVDDFGFLGQRPTHPELLDFLATEFRKDGQSLKKTIRRIVLSQTYRMSGQCDPAAVEADPKNLLWHHRPPKRLEGEVIRDSLLAVSGRLDRTQFGPSVKVHLTPFMEGRGRPPASGPVDGSGRRSIYLEVRRNFLSPFMLTFDTPNPFSTMGRRNVSNVPAQALILMNDPFVRECAESWSKRAAREAPADVDGRTGWFYETALGRPPTADERHLLRNFVSQNAAGGTMTEDAPVWADVAHAMVNTKEFVFVP